MKNIKQKYIFDLDGTLLESSFTKENEYFKANLRSDESKILISKKYDLLMKYEKLFPRYDINLLSQYFTNETSINITPDFIDGWLEFNKSNSDDTIIDGVVETLEELKRADKNLVVLTNWVRKTQLGRLKTSGLDIYFDEVYGGDFCFKPNKEAFLNACGNTPSELCVMIGDDYKKDYLGCIESGIDAIHFDRKDTNPTTTNSVKSLRKIKELY